MTLDELIRQAFREGATGVTLWPTPGGFQGNVRVDDGWQCTAAADPVDALRAALGALRVSAKPTDTIDSGSIFD